MSFHNPGCWLWALAAVVIAAFYLWRYAGQSRQVAAWWLWQKALARRPAWIGLRRWASIAVHGVTVLLIAGALAEPYWTAIYTSRRNIALVLDVSASMSAPDARSNRFEGMRELARRAIENLQRGERMAIIAAADRVSTLCPLTDDKAALLATIDTLQPTRGNTRIALAVNAARAAVSGRENARVVVISDGCVEEMAIDPDVRMVLVGKGAANSAITRVLATPDARDPSHQHVLVEIANHSDQAVTAELQLAINGQASETREVSLPADSSRREQFILPVLEDGVLAATLNTPDALPEDNTALVRLHSQRKPVVALVTGGHPKLESALASCPDWDLQRIESLAETPSPCDVLVVHGAVPESLPPGRVIVVEPENDCQLWRIGNELRGPAGRIAEVAGDSEVLQGVDGRGIVVDRAVQLVFSEPVEPIISAKSGDTLCALIDRPAGPVLVINLPLRREHCDWILRADFDRLLQNAVHALLPQPIAREPLIAVGESYPLDPQSTPLTLTSSSGSKVVAAAGQAFVVFPEAGIWRAADGQVPPILVQPSGGEAELRPATTIRRGKLELAEPVFDQPLWMLLIGLAVVMLVVETCLYHRRYLV